MWSYLVLECWFMKAPWRGWRSWLLQGFWLIYVVKAGGSNVYSTVHPMLKKMPLNKVSKNKVAIFDIVFRGAKIWQQHLLLDVQLSWENCALRNDTPYKKKKKKSTDNSTGGRFFFFFFFCFLHWPHMDMTCCVLSNISRSLDLVHLIMQIEKIRVIWVQP